MRKRLKKRLIVFFCFTYLFSTVGRVIPFVYATENEITEEMTIAEEPTTAEEPATVEEVTTAEEPTTVEEVTTAEEPTTMEEVTTAEEPTTEEATTEEVTTAEEPTTEEVTTAEEPTTEEETTTEEVTTIEEPTTEESTTEAATEEASTETATTEAVIEFEEAMIIVDGELSEWKAVDARSSNDSGVSEWKVAESENGTLLYFSYTGIATTQWDTNYIWDNFKITYEDGTKFNCQIANLASAWTAPGAEVAMQSNASGTNPGIYAVECVLPITESGYTVTFAGNSINEADMQVFVPSEEEEAVYTGIVIDGNYDDWDAVSKVEASCPESANHSHDCLDYAACVFDGDYVYIYLQDGATGSAAGAGAFNNGRYSVTTDTGRQLVFQLSAGGGGSVSGVSGALVSYFGNEWEIAIPKSELPYYKESISFGLYQAEPFISGIINLQGDDSGGTAGEFTGIVYDGLYGDWYSYPHTLIQYATSGTQTDSPDGEGALYADGSILYGHVVSSMDAHVAEKGGEFASAISICFNEEYGYNGDKTWNLYPKLVAVATDGTINWNPQTEELPNGQYEFYIADIRGEYNTKSQTNVSALADYEQFFGKLTVTVNDTFDEMEFYVDLDKVAKFLSHYSDSEIEANDFKVIGAQFGRIGNNFIVTAGSSSGAYMGISMCMGVTGLVLLKRKRNKAVK